MLCRKAWRVVRRLFPDEFLKDVPNPWVGVTMKSRVKKKKPAVTRDEICTFAHGCIEHGEVEAAAVAVICFEWLRRPENVIAGHVKWSGYRTGPKPTIRIEHHKTGEIVDHPLEDGEVKFYEEAEEVLSHLKRLGTPMVLYEVEEGKAKPFGFSTMQHEVQRMRAKLGLPSHFTFDACRHGGMTELEEAELTDGQGRALSAHRTQQSYAGYAKRTAKRMLAATRKPMRIDWQRTNRGIPFGMRRRKAFGMKGENKMRLLSNINWLGREGSNLRMAESKSAALPLGYAPVGIQHLAFSV